MKSLVCISIRILIGRFQVVALFKSAIFDFFLLVFYATKNEKRYSFEYFIFRVQIHLLYGREKNGFFAIDFGWMSEKNVDFDKKKIVDLTNELINGITVSVLN